MPPENRALWEAVRSALGSAHQGPPLGPARPRRTACPSPVQEYYWRPDRPERGGEIHVATVFRIPAAVDAALLERCLIEIARRHQVLRTVFRWQRGRPYADLLPETAVWLAVVDLCALPQAVREAGAERLIAAEARQVFPLGDGPLAAFKLLCLADERSVLLATFHHSAFDGWSLSVFTRELSLLYEAFAAGRPSPLAEPPLQYADYSRWRVEWRKSPAAREQLAWWRKELKGCGPAFRRKSQPSEVTLGPAAQAFRALPKDLEAAVRDLAGSEGGTAHMAFLAGFLALLHRFTGREDLCLGSVVAGRNRRELVGLIGCFLNTVVVRASLCGDPPFRDLLRRVRTSALGAFAHPDMPFGDVLAELSGSGEPIDWPLHVMFLFQSFPAAKLRLVGCEITPTETPTHVTDFPCLVMLIESESGLVGQWQGHRDFFDERGLAALAEAYEEVLRAATAAPDRRLSTLPPAGSPDRALCNVLSALVGRAARRRGLPVSASTGGAAS
jgi:hypothetical protein